MKIKLLFRLSLFILFNFSDAFSAEVFLFWKPVLSQTIAGYKIYYGTESKVYAKVKQAGKLACYSLQLDESDDYYVVLTAYDQYGDESDYSDEMHIAFDRTPPQGSIKINGGAESTTFRIVLLRLDAEDAESGMGRVAKMKLSNDGINWQYEGPYLKYFPWLLAEDAGEQTVYAKFIDAAGNEMENPVSSTIIHKKINTH